MAELLFWLSNWTVGGDTMLVDDDAAVIDLDDDSIDTVADETEVDADPETDPPWRGFTSSSIPPGRKVGRTPSISHISRLFIEAVLCEVDEDEFELTASGSATADGGTSTGHRLHTDLDASQYTSTMKLRNEAARRFEKHFLNAASSYWLFPKHAALNEAVATVRKLIGTRRPKSRWVCCPN